MKKISTYILLTLIATALASCQTMPDLKGGVTAVKNRLLGGKHQAYHKIDPADLNHVGRLAISVFEMEKLNLLQSFPYATVSREGRKLDNRTDYTRFVQRNVVIMDFSEEPDGIYAQQMLSESVDRFGRIDVSNERIIYQVREPNGQEVAALTESMLNVSAALKKMDKTSRAHFQKALTEYQSAGGLAPDGIMGRKTAESLAQELPILDIREMANQAVYPQIPRNALYVVPYEEVERNPEMFNKGFESLEKVKEYAMRPDEFNKLDRTKQRFVVFVYFLDRVNPTIPIRLGLADAEQRWSEKMSPKLYAAPGEWPVIIQTFGIDESLGSSRLYANLFMKYKCIGSQRIK